MSWGRVLVAVQVAILVVTATAVVLRFQIWAIADEAAHYDYVQTIVEDGRLPLISDVNHAEVRAIAHTQGDPATIGLAGHSYEAFQPPLYYLAAAPAFAIAGDHRDKVRVVRLFDALLLGLCAVLLLRLARAVVPERPLPAFAAGLAVLALPGVVVRSVTIAPAPLELVMVTALVLALWHVRAGGGRRWLIASAVLVAACFLTKNTLVYVVPVWLLVLGLDWRARRDTRATGVALVIPALLIAPWLAFNHHHYGSFTATAQAQDQQREAVNPFKLDFGVSDVASDTRKLPDDVVPREWQNELDTGWIKLATVVLLLLPLLGLALSRRGPPWLLAAPALTGYVLLAAAMVVSDWPTLVLRYLFAALPVLAVAAVAALPQRRALIGVTAATALTAVLWLILAGAFMFTDVGSALGIHHGTVINH